MVSVSASVEEFATLKPIALEDLPELVEVPVIIEPAANDDLVTDEELDPEVSSVLRVGSIISSGGESETEGVKYLIFKFLIMEYDNLVGEVHQQELSAEVSEDSHLIILTTSELWLRILTERSMDR